MQFNVSQLAAWPDITRIVGRHFDHVSAAGTCCHGPHAVDVQAIHQRAPRLSLQTRSWVRTLLGAGISTQEIMRQSRQRFADAKKLAPSSRDHFLKRQDVRNLEHTLAESTWKLHDDEATSVRLFQQRHEKNIFMYREQHPEQPDNDSQTHQPAQPFVMGLVTDGMREAALKHGHDGVVCLDATFSPNHMKFSLYTALVVDTHGNGLPIFEVLSESTTHPAVTEWMVAFQRYMHTFQADWRPSCFMVDDAGCERNKARKIAEESSAIAA